MSSYFPIPPNIWIKELSENIYGSITFLNIPNNQLKNNLFSRKYNDNVYLGVYCIEKFNWKLLKVFKCKPNEFIEIKRSELNVNNNRIIVVVPKKNNNFIKKTNKLLKPDSLRLDRSPIAERVSINFHLKKSFTSYQGEYPYQMTLLKKSSFLTFDILKNSSEINNINFLILTNIFKESKIQDYCNIEFFNPHYRENIKLFKAKRNSYTIKRVCDLEKKIGNEKPLFLKSNKFNFIPLMLSINIESKQLSLEHTHPPTEFFYGLKKYEAVKLIKNQWLQDE